MAILVSAARAGALQLDADPGQEPAPTSSSGASVTLFPSGDIYPAYVADPHRPSNVFAESFTIGGGIPASRSPQTRLGGGGRFGICRIEPALTGGRSWQLSFEGGLDAVFDSQNRLDVIGWDGNYGLTVTTTSDSPLSLKFAVFHVSAHLGDEYQERTGRVRLNYTREELSVGAAWRWSPRWRAYGETGVAYKMGDPVLEPWRAQWGIEHASSHRIWGQRFGWFVAADFSTMQERDWRLDVTVDVGIVTWSEGGGTPRIFLQWHDGRPTVNEFFSESESTLALAVRIDM